MTSTVPLTAHVLATVFRAVRDLDLPAPVRFVVDGRRVDLGFRAPADVDAWQRHIGLPPARRYPGARLYNEYGAIDFHNDGTGWCGARVVTISCPAEVSADAAA